MFCADHKTVKFAYGSNSSDFATGDDHGLAVGTGGSYTDLIKGDVTHTYKNVAGASGFVNGVDGYTTQIERQDQVSVHTSSTFVKAGGHWHMG